MKAHASGKRIKGVRTAHLADGTPVTPPAPVRASNAMDAACAACREQGPRAGCPMLALDDALNGRR